MLLLIVCVIFFFPIMLMVLTWTAIFGAIIGDFFLWLLNKGNKK